MRLLPLLNMLVALNVIAGSAIAGGQWTMVERLKEPPWDGCSPQDRAAWSRAIKESMFEKTYDSRTDPRNPPTEDLLLPRDRPDSFHMTHPEPVDVLLDGVLLQDLRDSFGQQALFSGEHSRSRQDLEADFQSTLESRTWYDSTRDECTLRLGGWSPECTCDRSEAKWAEEKAYRESKRLDDQQTTISYLNSGDNVRIEKDGFFYWTEDLAELYANARCKRFPRCVIPVTMTLHSGGSIIVHEEQQHKDLRAPETILAVRVFNHAINEDDVRSDLPAIVREIFAVYRTSAYESDEREWALAPWFGYPADYVPYAFAECGSIGNRAYAESIVSTDRRGWHHYMNVQGPVSLVFLARVSSLVPNDPQWWTREGETAWQLKTYHFDGCSDPGLAVEGLVRLSLEAAQTMLGN